MKAKLQNILLAPLGWLLHLLAFMPWWWIWLNADALYFIAYHVLGYRRKIVHRNLVDCFPEKSEAEIKRIEKQFYRHFTDYFFETVKMLHISEKEMQKRMVFHGIDLVERAYNEGRSNMIYAAHYFNWEWLTSISLWFSDELKTDRHLIGQAYHPLENQWFDRFFLHLRNRFSTCISSAEVLRTMIEMKREGKQMTLGFLSDQHPLPGHRGVITDFLHHPTDFINGTEAIARKFDMQVLYFHIRKTSRGHYECTLDLMYEHAKEQPKDSITLHYAQILEQHILEDPSLWMWTHNRWKRPVQYPAEAKASTSENQQ